MEQVHAGLDACLTDQGRPPLERARHFFELTQKSCRKEGYLGCLLGGLGQELSGVSEVFRRRIAGCLTVIAERLAVCLEEARKAGMRSPSEKRRGRGVDILAQPIERQLDRWLLKADEPLSLGSAEHQPDCRPEKTKL